MLQQARAAYMITSSIAQWFLYVELDVTIDVYSLKLQMQVSIHNNRADSSATYLTGQCSVLELQRGRR